MPALSRVYYVSVQPAAPRHAVFGKKYSCVEIPLRRTVTFLITSTAKIPAYKNTEGPCFAMVVGFGFLGFFKFVLKSAQVSSN